MKDFFIKRIILIVSLTLFIVSVVQAQTVSTGGTTRQQTIQKGTVLRKTSKSRNAYHTNNGTRENVVPRHQATDSSSRIQPMVTKPLPPLQTQP